MSVSFEINAQSRTDAGKGASRRLRHQGAVPGIIYGADREPSMITMAHNELAHALENEAFYSHILDLKLDGKSEQVVIKDLQRHPAKPFIMHVDFQRVDMNEKLRMHAPLHFINEETSPGMKMGGNVSHSLSDVEIICLPKDLPEFIEVDMADMDIGDSVHLSDLQLPDGVELTHTGGEDSLVAMIHVGHTGEDGDEEGGVDVEEAVGETAPE
ncbi:MAG: 50S ribosomal protein L25/general stress protein Ctc [gamma proteobacterium endosymbiont of Lamellibrachia anaximandri]|nr:50S ribosomal protein L25/general stress protein Ctc [gamma proteobacterium endosymbiont of Lamellibrachia anaximandri]MBL3535030.1 50S ribosomal protein L25/general stress protein Ctc [gamma proteobacterium endosymbiont of Lamellibrachia anaximandri]